MEINDIIEARSSISSRVDFLPFGSGAEPVRGSKVKDKG